jgi:hypothetical protein
MSGSELASQPGEAQRRKRTTDRWLILGLLVTIVALYAVIGYGVYLAVDAIL